MSSACHLVQCLVGHFLYCIVRYLHCAQGIIGAQGQVPTIPFSPFHNFCAILKILTVGHTASLSWPSQQIPHRSAEFLILCLFWRPGTQLFCICRTSFSDYHNNSGWWCCDDNEAGHIKMDEWMMLTVWGHSSY